MCGIVGFVGKTSATDILLKGLERLEYRGYDSAGVAVLNGEIGVRKVEGRIEKLKRCVEDEPLSGSVGIGHTRWATHGAPTADNAHPHLSQDGRFAVVHNGIIENYTALKNELISEGFAFRSDTDTEVVAHLLQKYYKGDLLSAVRKTQARLKGSFALGIICREYPDTLVAVRQFSPLIIGVGKSENFIASDVTALYSHTRQVIYLLDGETAVITPGEIRVYSPDGGFAEKKVSKIDWNIEDASKDGYDHFMLKEICEQPRAVEQTVMCRIRAGRVDFGRIKLTHKKIRGIKRIVITGCGSAYHAGIVAKYVFEEWLRIPVEADVASEFRYRNPVVDDKTLVVVISQSGETADSLAALRHAKRHGAHILSVVNVVGSSIAGESDDVLYTHAGPEIAVATTKGYTTQLAVLYLLGLYCADVLGTVSEADYRCILNEICRLPEKIAAVIDRREELSALAKLVTDSDSLFFIGRNMDYAVSLEASLKLKEISYINSQAYAAGELKHGTISLIENGKTVVALSSDMSLADKIAANIKEVKSRGAFVVCSAVKESSAAIEADRVFTIPDVHPALSASVQVVPFQLFAYFAAVDKGCDVDKPRNLAKSVTVE